jgi:AMMECR1 domain-containing protein
MAVAGTVGSVSALEPVAPHSEDLRLGHPAPDVAPVDQTFLVRQTRRVIERKMRGEAAPEVSFVPTALEALTCRVSVTIRRQGRLVGTADSDALPVLEACREAALAAVDDAREKGLSPDDVPRIILEIELIGPREHVGRGNDTPQLLAMSYEPAIHGIAIRIDERETLIRPSQIISRETLCAYDDELDHRCNRYEETLQGLIEKLGLRKDPPARAPASVQFLRFQTTHLYEPAPGAPAVHLIAGCRMIWPEEITRDHLLEVVDDLGRYLRRRQKSDGLFAYEYLPGRDMYWPADENWVRQAATTWALAVHASARRDRVSAAALDRTLDTLSRMVRPLEGHPDAAFLATPDGRNPLGATALYCLALIDAPDRERSRNLRSTLINAIVAIQRPHGSFDTHFAPSTDISSQDYYPGEALLAVARQYGLTRDPRLRDVCDRALPFYQAYFRDRRPPMFVPWQVQAWGQMARATRLSKYADFVYEMSDWLAGAQLDYPDAPLSIYDGGFNVYGEGRAGISTGVYVEGYVDAARTAEALGDRERAQRYREIARRGSRFVLQLRFRPEECYYVITPEEVIGAIRNTPIDPTLRIDHCQHALMALLGTAQIMQVDER